MLLKYFNDPTISTSFVLQVYTDHYSHKDLSSASRFWIWFDYLGRIFCYLCKNLPEISFFGPEFQWLVIIVVHQVYDDTILKSRYIFIIIIIRVYQ